MFCTCLISIQIVQICLLHCLQVFIVYVSFKLILDIVKYIYIYILVLQSILMFNNCVYNQKFLRFQNESDPSNLLVEVKGSFSFTNIQLHHEI